MTAPVSSEVRLVRDIAAQFAHLPRAEAIAQVAAHIERFWAPPMIARLRVESADDPLVEAVTRALSPA